jgi:hypothetical protein
MLREGGIRLDDSDGEGYEEYQQIGRNTQPRIPKYSQNIEAESIKQIYD